MIVLALAAATAVAVVALLFSEYRGSRSGVWVAKPLASTGFVVVAVAAGALETTYGLMVLVALVLCWVGDVFLIPKGAGALFLVGLVSFLLGHLGFAVAFKQRHAAKETASRAAASCSRCRANCSARAPMDVSKSATSRSATRIVWRYCSNICS